MNFVVGQMHFKGHVDVRIVTLTSWKEWKWYMYVHICAYVCKLFL